MSAVAQDAGVAVDASSAPLVPAQNQDASVGQGASADASSPPPAAPVVEPPAPVDTAGPQMAAGADQPAPDVDVAQLDATAAPVVVVAEAPANDRAIDVTVRGTSAAERARQSAEAVHVIETTQAKREAADLGEVLARNEGISVRRAGGLGSDTRFSLNGLIDDQIRFFLDGVPLDLAGFAFGISNVPVTLIDRIDVYRGVVPVRFGMDALGGAVNLITDQEIKRSHMAASYMGGSFGTHRLSANGVYAHTPSGFFTRLNGFYDRADNDYVVEVMAPGANGRTSPARAHLNNNRYRAFGVSAEVGVAGRPWAKLLSLRGFVSDYDKGMPHNVTMTLPFGRVRYGTRSYGTVLRFERRFPHHIQLQALAGYAYDERHFVDVSTGIYDWYGRRTGTRTKGDVPTPGEIESGGYDRNLQDHSAYARSQLSWRFLDQQLRLALSPNLSTRHGNDAQVPEDSRDALEARQRLFILVTGLEYQVDLWDRRLENILFAKDYVYFADARAPLPNGTWDSKDANYHRGGVGDSLRLRISEGFFVKASYEWATRLPRRDEVFGDGMTLNANLDLKPETSHNVNLGGNFSREVERAGTFRTNVNLFLRAADQLIAHLPDNQGSTLTFLKAQNLQRARSMGVEAALGWTSPGDYVSIDGNTTWQDFPNLSTEGNAARYRGDPVPNRPWLFANAAARLRMHDAIVDDDTVELGWYGRYVHEFYRGWESAGLPGTKATVDTQFIQSILLTYVVRGKSRTCSSTLEISNLTDAKAYDFFGVQKPGRAAYFKATLEL